MREIHLNGYIDDEIWYGDEITPASLHERWKVRSEGPLQRVPGDARSPATAQ